MQNSKITVETKTGLISRRSRLTEAWRADCSKQLKVFRPEEAAVRSGLSFWARRLG
jgi:hypothetical protein